MPTLLIRIAADSGVMSLLTDMDVQGGDLDNAYDEAVTRCNDGDKIVQIEAEHLHVVQRDQNFQITAPITADTQTLGTEATAGIGAA